MRALQIVAEAATGKILEVIWTCGCITTQEGRYKTACPSHRSKEEDGAEG